MPDKITEATLTELNQLPSRAAQDVLAERQRQISAEGWTPEHDDEHINGELAAAGGAYAITAASEAKGGQPSFLHRVPSFWPFDDSWWKPKGMRNSLIKACALILAEIERIDRAEFKATLTELKPRDAIVRDKPAPVGWREVLKELLEATEGHIEGRSDAYDSLLDKVRVMLASAPELPVSGDGPRSSADAFRAGRIAQAEEDARVAEVECDARTIAAAIRANAAKIGGGED